MNTDFSSLKFSVGAFVSGGKKFFISSTNSLGLRFSPRLIKAGSSVQILELKVKNLGRKSIKVNSLQIADFFLPKFSPRIFLKNSWTQSGFSGYVEGIAPTKRKNMFLVRDQNPFSFKKEFGYLRNSLVSEWYTQIVGKEKSLVIGAITVKKCFSQIYMKEEKGGIKVRVTCQLDSLELESGKEFYSEKIAFITGKSRDSLEKFAQLVRKENKIKSTKKPVRGLCCAYYYQGNNVDEAYILSQLQAIDGLNKKLNLDLIQIDGVAYPWGDWPEAIEKHFPAGLDFVVKEIKKRGCMAGFWIAPFVASPQSKTFRKHKNWFLKDSKGKPFEARFTSPFDFLPFLSFRALDPTHPGVQKYLGKVIKKFVSLGFKFIKTDFTYPVGFSTNFYKPMTRAQALRLGFEIIKKAAGKKVLIQSGITQLSPLVGLIDYCRVGLDTLNPYVCGAPVVGGVVNNYMLSQNLRNCEVRNFWHNKIWVNDPDCIVFRSGTGISDRLIHKHKQFALSEKTSLWTGDNLAELNLKEKTSLLKFFNSNQKA